MKINFSLFLVLSVAATLGCTEGPKKFSGKLNQETSDPTTSDQVTGTEDPANADEGELTEEEAKEKAAVKLTDEEVLHGFPTGPDQMKILCGRAGTDPVRTTFCSATPPTVTSLIDLQKALGVAIVAPAAGPLQNGNPGFALTGHSSSLVGKFVNAINPRVVLFTTPPANASATAPFLSFGFVRGEQFAEIMTRDSVTNAMKLFLVNFEQACNAREEGCTLGELLSPAIESNWTKLTIYEDVDLKNTIVDCLHCHQPNGPGTPGLARMQELRNPWTHFFRDNTSGGPSLIADYQAAHGTTETYGGIPGGIISQSDPADLEDLVRGVGSATQPLEFRTRNIEDEIVANNAAQPQNNSVKGVSSTWTGLYEQSVLGNTIAIPYHDVKVTDPAKLQTMTAGYRAYIAGTATTMPDIRNAFLDAGLRDMGFMVKEGQPAEGILLNGCKQCHNDSLDQTISRAKFNVDLTKMSREEKDKAIQRIMLPNENLLAMPPRRFRVLTEAEKASLIELLKK